MKWADKRHVVHLRSESREELQVQGMYVARVEEDEVYERRGRGDGICYWYDINRKLMTA